MMINGDYYDAVGIQSLDYTLDKEIGEIDKNVPPEEALLKEDFVSNYLKEGTLIYSSKEDESVLLAKTEDGIQAFKRRT